MSAYVDANGMVRYYLHMGRETLLDALDDTTSESVRPLPVTDIARFEIRNAFEMMVFQSKTGNAARVTPEIASLAHGDFDADLAAGTLLRAHPLSLDDIESEFNALARRYTANHGFRTYDLIHVASALKLKCRRFLSFDAKANKLAKLVGLETL